MKHAKKRGVIRNSVEDAKTIMDESARMPDRDQVFSTSSHLLSTRPAGENFAHDESWSGDLEDEVKGDRDAAGDAVDELAHLRGIEHVPTSDELAQEDGDSLSVAPAGIESEGEQPCKREDRAPLQARAKDLTDIRAQLQRRRQDLREVIVAQQQQIIEKITPNESGESKVDFNHPADMIDGEADFEKNMTILAAERSELSLVEEALSRLDKDDYGYCLACGNTIPLPRLEAIPFAKFCIACQTRTEHRARNSSASPQ